VYSFRRAPDDSVPSVDPRPPDSDLVDLLAEVVRAVQAALADLDDWGLAGTIPGQHRSDLATDEAARRVLDRAGVGVLSEESGRHRSDADVTVVIDPLDGSTNAAHGIPWYACSLCAVDTHGPVASVVTNLASGVTYRAGRGRGAWRSDTLDADEGVRLAPSTASALADSIVGLSGFPDRYLGWRQYRALGAAALDLCLVASGALDAYIDCSRNAHGPWDYLGALLVCTEAGVEVVDLHDRDLVVLDHEARRTPIAASTPELLADVRRTLSASS
jgi:fructose-1,6-bisphosphatase/inositol monophosphatase family enzyme